MIETKNPKWNISDMHKDGHTGLHRACWGTTPRHFETVKMFISLGADPLEANDKGKTCIDMTTNKATVQLMLEAKNKA